MFKIFYILPFFFLVDAENNQTSLSRKLQPRIWGGNRISQAVFPYHVVLEMPHNNGICGGTLISTSFVLTAANCTIEVNQDGSWQPARQVVVRFGKSKSLQFSTRSYSMTVNKTDIIIHPLYYHNSSTLLNDIALIKLPREATLNRYVKVAYLPFKNEGFTTVGQELYSPGWGFLGDDENKKPTELQYIITEIVDSNNCIHPRINQFNSDSNICVNAHSRSICKGDFGGPNVVLTNGQFILIGISSHLMIPFSKNWYNAKISCEAGLPQVLTRVSHYIDWIHRHTGIRPDNYEL